MLKPFVLKSVAKPVKLILACPLATILSLCLSMGICIFLEDVLMGLWSFLLLQPIAILMTFRDPYFMNVWLAHLKCRKTRNYYPVKGNRYEP